MSIYLKSQNVDATNPTVTSTATGIYDLIDTAGSLAPGTSRAYYNSKGASGIFVYPEDGDVRYELGNTPTATKGVLLKEAIAYYLSGIDLEQLKLIRVSGNVKLSVQIIKETQ